MGNNTSRQEINSTIRQSLKVALRTLQTCKGSASGRQQIISHGPGSRIDHDVFDDWDQRVTLNLKCLQSIKVKNDVAQVVEGILKQAAEASSDFPSMNAKKKENISNTIKDISTAVTQEFIQKCVTNAVGVQEVRASGGGRVDHLTARNWKLAVGSAAECAQNSDVVQKIVTKLKDVVDQKTKDVQKAPFEDAITQLFKGGLLGALFGQSSGSTKIIIIIVIVIALAIAAFIAYKRFAS